MRGSPTSVNASGWKTGTAGVFFQFREVSWGCCRCRSTYLFLACDIKAHPWQCQRPHGADPVSVDFLSGVMDTLCNTDWGSRDTVSALLHFLWAHKWCCFVPNRAVTVAIAAAGVMSKSQSTKSWSRKDAPGLILSSGCLNSVSVLNVLSFMCKMPITRFSTLPPTCI